MFTGSARRGHGEGGKARRDVVQQVEHDGG